MQRKYLRVFILSVFIISTFLVSHTATADPRHRYVSVDIKPQSCPNPFNLDKQGVMPVAILGTANFNVQDIDVSTVTLNGISPIRSAYEDVSTPRRYGNALYCCTTAGADGFLDLTLKFNNQDLSQTIGNVTTPTAFLIFKGYLNDGTLIMGYDIVVFRGGNN